MHVARPAGRRLFSSNPASSRDELRRLESPERLASIANKCIRYVEARLQQVRSPSNRHDVLQVVNRLDEISNNLCCVIDYAEAAARLRPGTTHGMLARRVASQVFAYMSELNADRRLYDSLETCLGEDDQHRFLDEEARRVGLSLLRDFKISGIDLPSTERARFVNLSMSIQAIARRFEAGDEAMRHLFDLVRCRLELSNLLGYKSYAELHLQDKVLSAPDKVYKFLERVGAKISSQAWNKLAKGHQRHPTGLGLAKCLTLLRSLCSKYFDVDFKSDPCFLMGREATALTFRGVTSGEFMGKVYVCTTDECGAMACHLPVRCWQDGGAQNIVYGCEGAQTPICIVLFGSRDVECLSFSELQSLFHEFGHALHTICARTKYHHLSGTRCKLDFAEVPSMLMEVILQDRDIFSTVQTDKHFWENHDAWKRSTSQNNAQDLLRQVLLGKFDQFVHGRSMAEITSPASFGEAIRGWTAENAGTLEHQHHFLVQIGRFHHLVDYGASYYAYLFCQDLAGKIWRRFFDPTSKAYNPRLFLDKALSRGGTRDTFEVLSELEINDGV